MSEPVASVHALLKSLSESDRAKIQSFVVAPVEIQYPLDIEGTGKPVHEAIMAALSRINVSRVAVHLAPESSRAFFLQIHGSHIVSPNGVAEVVVDGCVADKTALVIDHTIPRVLAIVHLAI